MIIANATMKHLLPDPNEFDARVRPRTNSPLGDWPTKGGISCTLSEQPDRVCSKPKAERF